MLPATEWRRVIELQLQQICPADGIAVFMHQHPCGEVHFPVALATGEAVGGTGIDIIACHPFFATQLSAFPTHCDLNPTTDIRTLLRVGKLATAVFEPATIRVSYSTRDNDARSVLAILCKGQSTLADSPINRYAESLLHNVSRMWNIDSAASISANIKDYESVESDVRIWAEGRDPSPPYSLFLHLAFGRKTNSVRPIISNELAYNCYVLVNVDEIGRIWNRDAMQRKGVLPWIDDIQGRAKGLQLAEAVAKLCVDVVLPVGECPLNNGVIRLIERHNMPRGSEQCASQMCEPYRKLNSPWELLRLAVERLSRGKRTQECLLLTSWLGEVNPSGQCVWAEPVGVSLCQDGNKFGELLTDPLLRNRLVRYEGRRLIATGLRVDSSVAQMDDRLEKIAKRQIENFRRAEAEIGGSEGFPPLRPKYEIVLRGLSGDIKRKPYYEIRSMEQGERRVRVVNPETDSADKKLFEAIKLLLEARNRNTHVPHDSLRALGGAEHAATVVQNLGRRLRRGDESHGRAPVIPERLFVSVKGKGYKLHDEVEVSLGRDSSGAADPRKARRYPDMNLLSDSQDEDCFESRVRDD